MTCSCSISGVRSQTSMCIRIRRATRYEPPAIHAAAPGTSVGATHTCWSRPAVSSDLMFAVPSLKPNMLRGVTCACDVDDVRPKPSWLQRTATTPKPIRTRLRTACTATCGSSEQAWMTMSPPERAGSRSSPRKPGSSRSASGLRSARPNRSSNRVGP